MNDEKQLFLNVETGEVDEYCGHCYYNVHDHQWHNSVDEGEAVPVVENILHQWEVI